MSGNKTCFHEVIDTGTLVTASVDVGLCSFLKHQVWYGIVGFNVPIDTLGHFGDDFTGHMKD